MSWRFYRRMKRPNPVCELNNSHSLFNMLELKLLTPDDAPALYALIEPNRAYLRQWINWLDTVQTQAECKQLLVHYQDMAEQRRGFHLGVFVGDDAPTTLAGIISLQAFDWHSRKAQLGYWIGASFQGQGIARQAVAHIINFAFEDLGLNRVEIHCATENTRSQTIPKALGFQHEGRMRQAEWLYDHFVDHELFALLADEFKPTGSS